MRFVACLEALECPVMPSNALPKHAPLEGFEVDAGNHIVVDGHRLADLVRDAGRTPLYVYSKALVEKRIGDLRSHLPRELKLHYALKANPHPELVRLIAGQLDGLDVASKGEMDVALGAGADPGAISFAGPGKTDRELTAAVDAGILINLESSGEARRLAAICSQAGKRARVAVRVNPAFELRQSGMHMGGGAKPFGIDQEQVPDAVREIIDLDLDFKGFHVFAGSQILDEGVLLDALGRTVDAVVELSSAVPNSITHVNLGGGFGIPYFPGEKRLDLARIGAGFGEILTRATQALPEAGFAIELGRYIVGEAGAYITRVIDRKISRGKVFLVTDGGLHHHLALSGNFGQVIRRNYPLMIEGKAALAAEESVDIVGCLCTPLDRLGDGVALPRVDIGDLVVVFQSGAYGASASPVGFLSHLPPLEVVV